MQLLCQGHSDAQAFVAKELPEPSLSPPHRGGEGAVNIHHDVDSLKLSS